jgi:hypothetical protein
MRMIDPATLAEAAQGALDRFGELTVCAEFGDHWSCTQPATPDGPARFVGLDGRGSEVWMRRWRCVAGHRYDLETLAPARNE